MYKRRGLYLLICVLVFSILISGVVISEEENVIGDGTDSGVVSDDTGGDVVVDSGSGDLDDSGSVDVNLDVNDVGGDVNGKDDGGIVTG